MPSNNEIIGKAVERAITSDDCIDLLLISDTLDDINGEEVGTDQDYGMHYNYLYIGMSGQRMVDQMNSNWRATDAQFLAHNNELNLRIISNQIKEIKVEDNIAYFTTDGKTWNSMLTTWGKITGNIADQADLAEILNDKIGTEQFGQLASQVSSNTSNIITITGNVSTLTDSVHDLINQVNGTGGILVRLNQDEALLAKKITSDNVLEIRTVNGTALEFTTDGTSWHPVSSAGQVEWGDIVGDIQNQADIQLLFSDMNTVIENVKSDMDSISEEMSDLNTELVNVSNTLTSALNTLETNLNSHKSDTSNPHKVNKEQLGLENVNNTADTDKPLSTAQKAYVDGQINEIKATMASSTKFQSVTKEAFEAITDKDNTTLYFINNL